MAVTTADMISAGLRVPVAYAKTQISQGTPSSTGIRGVTDWYLTGTPGGSTATTIGINGESVTPALASVASRIIRTNPASGNAYLARLQAKRGAATGALMLIDRLWQNSGLSVTSTTAQSITPATLPARDRTASTNGDGVMAAIEWSSASGAGGPTVTLTYTNQAGTAGQTASFTGLNTAAGGTFEIFPLAAGDTGVRAPTSFIQSATRTSGTMHLVLFRPIALIPLLSPNQDVIMDAVQLAMPRIYDDSVLQFVFIHGTTAGGGISAQYLETQG